MKLLLYGASKNSASPKDLGHYLLSEEEAQQQTDELRKLDGVKELLIVRSDFFTEYYFLVDEKKFQHGDFLTYLSKQSQRDIEGVILDTYSKFNMDLISHLLVFLSGIDYDLSSSQIIDSAEDSLIRNQMDHANAFLPELFRQAIAFVSDLQLKNELQSLFQSEWDITLQEIVDHLTMPSQKRFCLYGDNDYIYGMAKSLYRKGASHICLVSLDQEENEKRVDQLNDWVKKTQAQEKILKVFHCPDNEKSLLYYLSSADAIILDHDAYEQCLEYRGSQEEVEIFCSETEDFRFNDKRQFIFALNISPENWFLNRDYQEVFFIKEESAYGIADKLKVEEAKSHFEEETALEIERLFKLYQDFSGES